MQIDVLLVEAKVTVDTVSSLATELAVDLTVFSNKVFKTVFGLVVPAS